MKRRPLHTATSDEIRRGLTTDVYFRRTVKVLKGLKASRRVRAEFTLKSLPNGLSWGIFAGLEECLSLLEGKDLDVSAAMEGAVIRALEPVMVVEGDYADFALMETALLGLLCQASGVATKAARLRIAAGDRTLVSFGARRMHPAISPMIERSAFIGGCDGVATVKASQLVGVEASGTIPHALVILCGGIDEALLGFDKFIDRQVRRIALVDTFGDERFEALAACHTLGKGLYAVRLDTPQSRRGNFGEILREVRWELDLKGYAHVKIMASGGLDEIDMMELRDIVDGFGVGTCLSNARVLDYAMDIVEVDGEPRSKRGKMSGAKSVYRCKACRRDYIVPADSRRPECCECGGSVQALLKGYLKAGRIVPRLPEPGEIRRRVLKDLEWVSL
jgi:nicotinate phosphoribosyltransferase